MNQLNRSQVGGALLPDDPSYIERPADKALYDAIIAGEFCYVLTTRQMGKSSLMGRCADKLRDALWKVATIDLSEIGSTEGVTEDRWYYGVVRRIAQDVDMAKDLRAWWDDHDDLTQTQRMTDYFREVLLPNSEAPIAIFVDEIDSTIPLAFTDDFFAAIRAMYNARSTAPEFSRVTFVLLGVATPDQLMGDTRRTPFNIGRRIELPDFSKHQVRSVRSDRDEQTLDQIHQWTDGHPYLTQLLASVSDSDSTIDQLVDKLFFNAGEAQEDSNLKFVRGRLALGDDADPVKRQALSLYRDVIRGKTVTDNAMSPSHNELKLSGIVRVQADGTYRPRNRIYQAVFDRAWVTGELAGDTTLTRTARRAAVVSAGITAVAAIVFFIYSYQVLQPREFISNLEAAVDDTAVARKNYQALEAVPFYRQRADELMAEFWERHLASNNEFGRDGALIRHLQALSFARTPFRVAKVASNRVGYGRGYLRLLTTVRHQDSVTSVGFSADGTRVVTGSEDNTARVWDATTGAPVTPALKHRDWVSSVGFSGDGTRVVTGSWDNTARVWDATTGAPVTPALKHEGSVSSVGFSADGTLVATGSSDNTARVWDATTGAPVTPALKHGAWVNSVGFSADGTHVVTGSSDNTARVWDATSGAPVTPVLKHGGAVNSVGFSADGTHVVTGSWDNTARVWDARTGAPVTPALEHGDSVNSVGFSADGTRVVTGSGDTTARVWDATTGVPVTPALKHGAWVNSVGFSADGTRVVTGSNDTTARVWDARTGAPVTPALEHGGSVTSVSFSADATRVVTGGYDATARVWDARTGAPVTPALEHGALVKSVSFSVDGTRVVTGSGDTTARVWDARTGAPVTPALEHGALVKSVGFSADGTRVVTGSGDTTARVWDATTGVPVTPALKHGGSVNSVGFSADGTRVVTGSFDHTARVWDATSGAPVTPALAHEAWVTSVGFSADGTRVVTGSEDTTARVWDARTGAPVTPALEHGGSVNSVGFSADGTRVVTGSGDTGGETTARVWDARTGVPVTPALEHGALVSSAGFSADGTHVVTGSWDNTARVWDATSGAPVTPALKHGGSVTSVGFSADGTRVVTGSEDNTARVWDARTGKMLAVLNFGYMGTPIDVKFSNDGKVLVIASRWWVNRFESTDDDSTVLDRLVATDYDPNDLPAMNEAVLLDGLEVVLFATLAQAKLGVDYQAQIERLLKRVNLKLDEDGNLSYPYFVERAEDRPRPGLVP